jgi:hypothetical protein
MALPGLVRANNLNDVVDREKTWDNLGVQLIAEIADPDTDNYIAAVEAADGQPLELEVRSAIFRFIRGCKEDGIWTAIKASCILAGARTLNGALVPLVGTAPTSFNFVPGDYNRKTGLVGDGSTKYLNSNRNSTDDGQNNNHISAMITTADTMGGVVFGTNNGTGSTNWAASGGSLRARSSTFLFNVPYSTGLIGISRNNSASITVRRAGSSVLSTLASDGNMNENFNIFRRGNASPASSNARLAFYSIGESLDLALLDARVTTLINAFAAAIP